MAAPPTQNFQIIIPSQPRNAQNDAPKRARSLTVAQGLQYTPLTTSVSFASDRIPLPQIGRAKQYSRVSTSAERKMIQRDLAQRPLAEVEAKLNVLLNPDSLAELKFRCLPVSSQQPLPGTGMDLVNNDQLSSTARMVLEMTEMDYRYPTPSSPGSVGPASPGHPGHQSLTQSLLTPTVSKSPESRAKSDFIPAAGRTIVSPSKEEAIPNHKVVVEIPQMPVSQRSPYAQASGSPKRRKLDQEDQTADCSLRTRAQREIANSVLQQLQNQLVELFEADDRLEPSNILADGQIQEYFEIPDEADETGWRIALPQLERLQLALKKLVAYKRLNDIPADHLQRLQRICEHSIESTQTLRLRPQDDASEQEVNIWHREIRKAENGALSACICLWIIMGNLHDDSLISEETVGWVPHVLKNLFENCLIPVVEARPAENKDANLFREATEYRDCLKRLLDAGKRLLELAASVCVQGKLDEAATISLEFLAAKLVLTENGPTEKAAALGIQTFEKVRKVAMGVLSNIYAKFPKQRPVILDELLTSLNKLPSTSRSARQYKLNDGKNIQLITALMLQLVQTTTFKASNPTTSIHPRLTSGETHTTSNAEDDHEDEEDDLPNGITDAVEISANPLEQLRVAAGTLYENAAKSAQEIVNHLVSRASFVSKTGEDNARNLLDLFVEDLLSVLPLPDWPAAELLLRILASRMIERARYDKSASLKNMALEILGAMGSTISSLRASLPSLLGSVAKTETSRVTVMLLKLGDDQTAAGIRTDDLVSLQGPFQITHKFLKDRYGESLHSRSAASFQVVQWAKVLCHSLDINGSREGVEPRLGHLIKTVFDRFSESSSSPHVPSESVSATEAGLAHVLIVLNLGFGRRFGEMIKTLVASFSSEQAQVRSRSIKSVVSILETDSSLLDRDASIIEDIFACASDESAMVRDSALALIAKFIVPRPALEEKGIRRLLECAADSKVGVQKRAIGYLKDIYLADSRPALQSAVADALLRRLQDPEEAVASLATKTLSDIWITPYLSENDSASTKVKIQNLATILVQTIEKAPEEISPLLSNLISEVVLEKKRSPAIINLCSNIVSELFESIITDQLSSSAGSKQASLLTIKIFTEANAHTIGLDQLRALRPYLGNLTKQEDLAFFRPVVAVLNCVLSSLPTTQRPFLQEVQDDLMKTIAKLRRRLELDEVLKCLWTIDGALHNTDKLIRLSASVLKPLMDGKVPTTRAMQSCEETQRLALKTVLERHKTYVRIIGSIGKYWPFDINPQHTKLFRSKFPDQNPATVAAFLSDTVCPLTGPQFPASLRALALESLGSICVRWPNEFNKPEVWKSLLTVFQQNSLGEDEQTDLQSVVLASFVELFQDAEDQQGMRQQGEEKVSDFNKMGGDDKSIAFAGVLGQVAQKFLTHILIAAQARPSDKALIATKVMASINRQGQVHPKDCLGTMVALEGSTDWRISNIAWMSHQSTHQQHSSTYQPKYIEAIETAFQYQKNVVLHTAGVTRPGFKPKLSRCFDVINTSNTKYVKHFLQKLVERTTRDLLRVDVAQEVPDDLSFSRFIFHNLGFFDYRKYDELLHTILRMEVEFGQRGAEVVQAIEMLPESRVPEAYPDVVDEGMSKNPEISDQVKVKQIATAATILTMLWDARTFLKRVYGIGRDVRQALGNIKKDREAAKPPQKVHGISGERYLEKTSELVSSLNGPEAMFGRCRDFLTLMTIDDEVRVAADDDGLREEYSASLDIDERPSKLATTIGGKKRKSSASVGGTPKKKRGMSSLKEKPRRGSKSSTEDLDAEVE